MSLRVMMSPQMMKQAFEQGERNQNGKEEGGSHLVNKSVKYKSTRS